MRIVPLPDDMTMCVTWRFFLFFFFQDEILCKATWAIQLSQSRVTGLIIFRAQITETENVLLNFFVNIIKIQQTDSRKKQNIKGNN